MDVVPKLLPRWLGYYHHGNEVFYTNEFNVHKICDNTGEDPSCSAKLPMDFVKTAIDHSFYFKRFYLC